MGSDILPWQKIVIKILYTKLIKNKIFKLIYVLPKVCNLFSSFKIKKSYMFIKMQENLHFFAVIFNINFKSKYFSVILYFHSILLLKKFK